MQLVEQHIIQRTDPRFAPIDQAAFASKNLYNAALYLVRQSFILEHRYLGYEAVYHQIKHHEAYKALPAKVAQQVLRLLDQNWQSYFAACLAYQEDPSKFRSHPKLPGYKHKTNGRNVLVYTIQALSKPALKRGMIAPSMLPITVETKQQAHTIAQVRIVPRSGCYVVEIVYERAPVPAVVDPTLLAALDPGVTNLAAITSNKPGFVPRLVNGRRLKMWNQWANKRTAELQHHLGTTGTTRQMERVMTKRTRRINHALHTASRQIIDLLVAEGIGTLVIGKNVGWKQEVNNGKRNNQNFVNIPHARFVEMLRYKGELVGIHVIVQEESYTSKASFLDLDPIPTYDPKDEHKHHFSGKRIKRGLYRASDGGTLNADVNGAYNILRKSSPKAFPDAKGVAASVVTPVWLMPARSVQPGALAAPSTIPTDQ